MLPIGAQTFRFILLDSFRDEDHRPDECKDWLVLWPGSFWVLWKAKCFHLGKGRTALLRIIKVANTVLKREKGLAVVFLFRSYLSSLLPLREPEWSARLLVGVSYGCVPVPEEIISGWDNPIPLESIGVSSKGWLDSWWGIPSSNLQWATTQ